MLLLQMWTLAASAGDAAALGGAPLQIVNQRRQPTWNGDVQAALGNWATDG